MSHTNIHLTVVKGQQGFEQLQPQWRHLAQQRGTHFLHFPAWYQARLAVMPEPDRLWFVSVCQGAELKGVIPLEQIAVAKGPLKISAVTLAYANEMGLCDLFLPEPELLSLPALMHAVRDAGIRFRFFKFDCISDSSMAAGWLRSTALPTKASHVTKYLDLSAGRDQFYGGYSSKFKRNMRRKLKKANEMGEVQVERYYNQSALEAFDTFLQLENSGWKGREGTSIAQQPDKLQYYRTLAQGYSDDGVLSVNVLTIGGTPVAAQIGILIRGVLNLLKIAYDEGYSEVSPGYLLIDNLITEPDDDHYISKISFVTGVDWIDRWKPQCESVRVAYTTQLAFVDHMLGRVIEKKAKVEINAQSAELEQ